MDGFPVCVLSRFCFPANVTYRASCETDAVGSKWQQFSLEVGIRVRMRTAGLKAAVMRNSDVKLEQTLRK